MYYNNYWLILVSKGNTCLVVNPHYETYNGNNYILLNTHSTKPRLRTHQSNNEIITYKYGWLSLMHLIQLRIILLHHLKVLDCLFLYFVFLYLKRFIIIMVKLRYCGLHLHRYLIIAVTNSETSYHLLQ